MKYKFHFNLLFVSSLKKQIKKKTSDLESHNYLQIIQLWFWICRMIVHPPHVFFPVLVRARATFIALSNNSRFHLLNTSSGKHLEQRTSQVPAVLPFKVAGQFRVIVRKELPPAQGHIWSALLALKHVFRTG